MQDYFDQQRTPRRESANRHSLIGEWFAWIASKARGLVTNGPLLSDSTVTGNCTTPTRKDDLVMVVSPPAQRPVRPASLTELYERTRKVVCRGQAEKVEDCLTHALATGSDHLAYILSDGRTFRGVPFVNGNYSRNADHRQPGKSMLHWAVQSGHPHVVKMLLNAGSLVDAKDSTGCSALYYAIKRADAAMVEMLLSAGATREPSWPDGPRRELENEMHENQEIAKLFSETFPGRQTNEWRMHRPGENNWRERIKQSLCCYGTSVRERPRVSASHLER